MHDSEDLDTANALTFRTRLESFTYRGDSSTNEQTGQATWPASAITETQLELGRSPRKRSTTTEVGNPAKLVPEKKRKLKRGFASPDKYSHLNPLQDYLTQGLDIVFCGINPGRRSAEIGHHFGGPTNHFWLCLHESGLTPVRLQPTKDYTLPEQFSFGMTNLVDRPTAEQLELSRAEQIDAVPAFINKIKLHRPRIVCFVGLGIARIVRSRILRGQDKIQMSYGLQPFKIVHAANDYSPRETLFFAVASTSGRVVHYSKNHKIKQFKELKSLLGEVKSCRVDTTDILAIEV